MKCGAWAGAQVGLARAAAELVVILASGAEAAKGRARPKPDAPFSAAKPRRLRPKEREVLKRVSGEPVPFRWRQRRTT